MFNVWNGVTTGTLVVPTFQEGTTIFHHCDGGVRTPVEGMVSQKYNRSDRSGVRCRKEADLRALKLPYYKVTRDDKIYFTN